MLINLSGSDVVLACEGNVEISFVVSEIEIDFTSVVKNEYLSMPLNFLSIAVREDI